MLKPVFTPRIRLGDSALAGFEVRICRSHGHALQDLGDVIPSPDGEVVLNEIRTGLISFQAAKRRAIRLSLTLSSSHDSRVAGEVAARIVPFFPSGQVEVMLDCHVNDAGTHQRLSPLVALLNEQGIKVGIGFSRLIALGHAPLLDGISVVKFYKAHIRSYKENINASSDLYRLISFIKGEGIEIALDGLKSKTDVADAILMGFDFGQGLYLSANQIKNRFLPVNRIYTNFRGGGLVCS